MVELGVLGSRRAWGRREPAEPMVKLGVVARYHLARLVSSSSLVLGLLKGFAVAEAHAFDHLGEALRAVQSAPVPLGGRMHAVDKISGVDPL